MISFTIDGTNYEAEEGMTWNDWGASKYCTEEYSEGTLNSKYICKENDINHVHGNDLVIDGQAYVTKTNAGGGAA